MRKAVKSMSENNRTILYKGNLPEEVSATFSPLVMLRGYQKIEHAPNTDKIHKLMHELRKQCSELQINMVVTLETVDDLINKKVFVPAEYATKKFRG